MKEKLVFLTGAGVSAESGIRLHGGLNARIARIVEYENRFAPIRRHISKLEIETANG